MAGSRHLSGLKGLRDSGHLAPRCESKPPNKLVINCELGSHNRDVTDDKTTLSRHRSWSLLDPPFENTILFVFALPEKFQLRIARRDRMHSRSVRRRLRGGACSRDDVEHCKTMPENDELCKQQTETAEAAHTAGKLQKHEPAATDDKQRDSRRESEGGKFLLRPGGQAGRGQGFLPR